MARAGPTCLLAGFLVLALTGGCVSGRPPAPRPAPSTSPAPPTDATLRWGITEPTAIVPADAVTVDDLVVVDALFDSLTSWDDRLQVRASAAQSWWTPDGGRTWRFSMRRGAVFHDGSAVDAQDVVTAWTAVVRGAAHHHLRDVVGYEALRGGHRRGLRGVHALDAHTLQVRLRTVLMDFPAVVGHPALAPVPSERWRADERAFRERPVGNGPFTIAAPWTRGRALHLRRGQAGGAVPPPQPRPTPPPDTPASRQLAGIVFLPTDPAAGYVAFQQGRLDVATVPTGALTDAREASVAPRRRYEGPGLLSGPVASTYLLGFALDRPPFDDRQVRAAVAGTIRRDALAESVFEGGAEPARAVIPRVVPGARSDRCEACTPDRAEAAATFARLGIEELTLWVDEGGGHEQVASRMQSDFAAVGVTLDVRTLSAEAFLAARRRGALGFFRSGWSLDYPTLDNGLYPLLHSRGAGNLGRYADAAVDRWLESARASTEPRRRAARYRQAAALAIARDHAVVPLVHYEHRTVVAERVVGLRLGTFATADLSGVWLRPADGS